MKTLCITLMMILSSGFCMSQDPVDIIRKSQTAVKVNSFEAVTTLTIADSRGNERIRQSSMASRVFEDMTEKRIIKFTSPAEVKGTGILIYDHEDKPDDMWIYLPALKKTRRIVSSEKSKGFMGSEFSNADMTAPAVEDFAYSLEGASEISGTDCWMIKASPASTELEDEYGYGSSMSWIGKDDYIVRKTNYFDFDGNLMKTIETINFKTLDPVHGKSMITEMVATNYQNGRSSRMKMDKIQIAKTDENYFSVAYLER